MTLLYILIRYYNKINEKYTNVCSSVCTVVAWSERLCVFRAICIIYKYKEREREIVMTEREKVWWRKCFFYMIINVSIIQRHRHMVLKITHAFYPTLSMLPLISLSPPFLPHNHHNPSQNDSLLENCSHIHVRRRKEDDEEEEEETSRGCAVEINVVALSRASPYRRAIIITF